MNQQLWQTNGLEHHGRTVTSSVEFDLKSRPPSKDTRIKDYAASSSEMEILTKYQAIRDNDGWMRRWDTQDKVRRRREPVAEM